MGKRLFTMLLLSLLPCAVAAAGAKEFYEKWMQHCPKAQVLMKNPKVELGRCVAFNDNIGGALCNELRVSNRVVGWVTDVYMAQTRIVAHLCVASFDDNGVHLADQWSQTGTVSHELYLLSAPTEDPGQQLVIMTPLTLPGYSGFSSPSGCGTKLAYWGSRESGESAQWEALVIDLNDQSVIANKRMGFKDLETDNRGHLSPPAWTKNCEAVTFEYPSHMNKPSVTLGLRK